MKPIDKYQAYSLPIAEIHVDPDFNCRSAFTHQSVEELAGSIQENGLDVPVTVQPIEDTGLKIPYQWRLLAGFRRFMAVSKILRWKEIPATIVQGLSDVEAVHHNFRENVERKNLNPLEEAQWLVKHFDGKPLREIGKLVGRDPRWVHQRLRLAAMPEQVQHKFASGVLSLLDIDSLSKLSTPEEQIKGARLIIEAKRKRDFKKLPKLRKARQFRPRKTKGQITKMMRRLMEMGHTGLITRFGAWCAGWISDEEFEDDLKKNAGK